MEMTPDLQNRTCVLLESWWSGEREGREELIPNSLLYLIAKTLNEGAKVSNRKKEEDTVADGRVACDLSLDG